MQAPLSVLFHTTSTDTGVCPIIPTITMPDEKEVQVETPEVEPPVTEPAQVEVETPEKEPAPVTEKIETPPVEEPAKEPEAPTKEAVPQSDWQELKEEVKALQQEKAEETLEKFEADYPIVKTEKYKDKWAEYLVFKQTPGHKYSGLSYEELLNLIRDNSTPPEPQPAPTPVPSLNPSAAPDAPRGEIDGQVSDMLSQRYNQDQIDSTKG